MWQDGNRRAVSAAAAAAAAGFPSATAAAEQGRPAHLMHVCIILLSLAPLALPGLRLCIGKRRHSQVSAGVCGRK